MIDEKYQSLLEEFNDRWSLKEVQNLTIDQYSGLNDKETFCQWVETQTRPLGSIKGVTSQKFGLYRTRSTKMPKTAFIVESGYCWSKKLGKTRDEAFSELKRNICKVISAAQITDLEAIDKVKLHSYFKWKLATLYSYGVIPPIFNHQVLRSLAKAYNVTFKNGKAGPVLKVLMSSLPVEKCRIKFSFQLFKHFYLKPGASSEYKKKSEAAQLRKFKKSEYKASQRHSEIQNKLMSYLRAKYPLERVVPEEQNIDVIRESKSEFILYEVKSSQSPTYCIREALGQVLSYAYLYNTEKKKRVVVVGSSEPNETEKEFIDYLCKNLSIKFGYMALPLS